MSSIYVPNEGEKEALKSILLQRAMTIGFYKNQIIPDGSTLFSTLEELTTGAGYGYAPIELSNDVKEGAAAADWWTILVDAAGKASAVYGAVSQSWVFLAPDVALSQTVYGVFGFCRVLPFTTGLHRIKVGSVLRQGAVCAVVIGVNRISGSWAVGDAAGNLYIKNQSGVFVAGATLIEVSNPTTTGEAKALVAAPTVAGTGYAVGDLFHITTGGTGAIGRVTAVTAGVPTAVELVTGGDGYTAAAGKATAKINGAGDNALTVEISALIATGPAVAVATLAGDSSKKLLFCEALTTPIPVTTLGQTISYTPTLTMSTG